MEINPEDRMNDIPAPPDIPVPAKGPALTVIIPHLNAPEVLEHCLQALSAQRGEGVSFEVIVVDNGSEQRPETVCAAYDFVRLSEEATPGPGPARNHGASLAQGPLLAFIDCDCIAQPGWITSIAQHFARHPGTDVIGGDVCIARVDPAHATAIEAYESVYGYRFKLYIEKHGYSGSGNMAVRRPVFEQVGGFAGIQIAEDMDWGRRAAAAGMQLDYVPLMRIDTAAREDFRQLARKWDRHIGHDFETLAGAGAQLRWGLRALALALSPLAEMLRIVRSERISGARERWLAWRCLCRIRLYRCARMLRLLAGGDGRAMSGAWRRRG
jgi:glycosyltransferase involved in cell wall biosynthesis